MKTNPYGFRILGDVHGERRLVQADAAFVGYATCDVRADVSKEAYLSAFHFGDDFRELLASVGSCKGFRGACWSPWLWFDIDRENDLDAALTDTRRLAHFLGDRYRLGDEDLLAFYSGSKGFHVGLPTSLFASEVSEAFHRQVRTLAEQLAGAVGIVIDTGVYDRVRAFRAPNSRHPKTGRHKRRLTLDELTGLSLAGIVDLAKTPTPFDVPTPPDKNEQAEADWRQACETVKRRTQTTARRRSEGAVSLNRLTLDFIRNGAEHGDRHRLLYSAARNLGEFFCPPALAHGLLTEAGLDCGLSPSDVRRQIECGLKDSGTVADIPKLDDSEATIQTSAVKPSISQEELSRLWNHSLELALPEDQRGDAWEHPLDRRTPERRTA